MMFNSSLYADWLTKRDLNGLPTPDADGYFRRGDQVCVLPLVRAYWIRSRKQREQDPSCRDNPPVWKSETWRSLGDGWARYLRADQALDLIASYAQPEENGFPVQLSSSPSAKRRAIEKWLANPNRQNTSTVAGTLG